MIAAFDHVVIGVRDLGAAIDAYECLLGYRATRGEARDGIAQAVIGTSNMSVELIAPVGDGEGARRLEAALADGEGLKSLVFRSNALDADHKRLERVGLAPAPIEARETWRSFRVDTARSHGVRLFMLERSETPAPLQRIGDAGVLGLDHIVIRSPDAERAAALFGARLGLDMRLDREVAGRRLMFFRCGDAIVEIVHDSSIEDGRDRFWGLSWRVVDADTARARLAAAGLDVSDVRAGMKPGTRVFTVRNQSCGVPTLMIEQGRQP